jgi:hypothetical protein
MCCVQPNPGPVSSTSSRSVTQSPPESSNTTNNAPLHFKGTTGLTGYVSVQRPTQVTLNKPEKLFAALVLLSLHVAASPGIDNSTLNTTPWSLDMAMCKGKTTYGNMQQINLNNEELSCFSPAWSKVSERVGG